MNGALLTLEQQMALAESSGEYCDIPPRTEPDKYLYIFTREEKGQYGPRQPKDQVWILRQAWAAPERWRALTFDAGCCYRRFKLTGKFRT